MSILARPKTSERKQKQATGLGGDAFSVPAPEKQFSPDKLRLHPECDFVPELAGGEYTALLADVRERGLLTPLEVTKEGVVLDGRGRLRVARELGLTQVPIRLVAPEDEVRHLVLAALNRRHLSQGQKAAIVVELEEYEQARVDGRRRKRANLRGATDVATLPHRGERTREFGAQRAGVCARTVQDVQTVKDADPMLFAAVKAGQLPAHKAARLVRRKRRLAELPVAPPLPDGAFQLVYADPPWPSASPDSPFAPENHYPTMALSEIETLAPPAETDAVLFLWAISSLLPQALAVMSAWGFTYKSSLVWVKPSIGLGSWVRHRHEHLLVGSRGSFRAPERENRPDSVIEAPRRRHSQKPDCVYELIERMYPAASKLELFARGAPRPGWTAWGNEVAA